MRSTIHEPFSIATYCQIEEGRCLFESYDVRFEPFSFFFKGDYWSNDLKRKPENSRHLYFKLENNCDKFIPIWGN